MKWFSTKTVDDASCFVAIEGMVLISHEKAQKNTRQLHGISLTMEHTKYTEDGEEVK